MEKIEAEGKLKLSGAQSKDSIDYVPVNIDESIEFLRILRKEMELQNLATAGKTVSQIREEIRSHLEAKK